MNRLWRTLETLTLATVYVLVMVISDLAGAADVFEALVPILAPMLGLAYVLLILTGGLAPSGWCGFVFLNKYSRIFIAAAGINASAGGICLLVEPRATDPLLAASVGMAVVACLCVAVHWLAAAYVVLRRNG